MNDGALTVLRKANNESILDAWIGEQNILYIFWIDVKTIREHYEIFFTPLDIKKTTIINRAKISGIIPPILKGAGRGFGVFPVAPGNVGATRENLTIFSNTHLLTRQANAHCPMNMHMI